MHRAVEVLCAFLNRLIIMVVKVIEHTVDHFLDRIAVLIEGIRIREKIAFQPPLLRRKLFLQEFMLEGIFVQRFIQLRLRANAILNQSLPNLSERISFRDGDFHRFLFIGIAQCANNLVIIHRRA